MSICNCPKCNSVVGYTKDLTGKYKIICENCKKNGITIEVEGNSLDEVLKKWNDRPLIKLFLRNLNETFDFFKLLAGKTQDLKFYDKTRESFNRIYLNDMNYLVGWFIFKNKQIFTCFEDHINILLTTLGFDSSELSEQQKEDILKTSLLNGNIRITFYGKTLGIEWNKEKITKDIKNILIDLFYDNYNTYLKNISEFIFVDIKTDKTECIYSFNDMILYIDSK